ncbi:hypothetical protein NADFUDRAFT_46768 [Nadsonia fulvescens var. elongata DSM 6958]|uniref:Letm1 RBD domain-containing protein n=1 Tax=Nadsonia fulvescens var. elongata DSM 6958 TaxID=857566 RepID=A0A1E3PHX1_9ASCO|nr:hypothetical protein NADFUDRAFT_46768 [Nadsonia fulvescens var. elongata DSM 6958]
MIRLISSPLSISSSRTTAISTLGQRNYSAPFTVLNRQYYNDALSALQTHNRQSLREKYSKQENSLSFQDISDEKALERCLRSPIFQQNWFVEDDVTEGLVSGLRPEVDKEMARIMTLKKKKFKSDIPAEAELLTWKLNCPTSVSYPIDSLASIKTKESALGTVKRHYSYLKSILSLYKNGMKNLYTNYLISNELFNRLGLTAMKGGNTKKIEYITMEILNKDFYKRVRMRREREEKLADQVKAELSEHISGNISNVIPVNVQVPLASLTRAEYNLILRTSHDIRKLPLFVLIFCIFFEFTPLVMRIFTSLNPQLCLTPGQTQREFASRSADIHALKSLSNKLYTGITLNKQLSRTAYNLSKSETRQLARVLKVVSRSVPTVMYPDWILQDRIEAKFKQIKADDILIGLYGGVWNLNMHELNLACLDRGIALSYTIPDDSKASTKKMAQKSEEQLRVELFYWITNLSKGQYNIGFLFYDLAVRDVENAEILCYLNEHYSMGIHRLKSGMSNKVNNGHFHSKD